jgi:hypothetical protein
LSKFRFYTELEFVQWYLQSSHASSLIDELDIYNKDYLYKINIIEPFYKSHKEGDIDILFYAPTAPHKAIAVQCKTLHISVKENQIEKPDRHNKKRIDQLVIQANKTLKLGFFKTYVFVFIQIDCRERIANNVFFKTGLSQKLDFKLRTTISDKINDDIGVIFVVYSQFADKNINDSGGIYTLSLRPAIAYTQKDAVSENIKKLED